MASSALRACQGWSARLRWSVFGGGTAERSRTFWRLLPEDPRSQQKSLADFSRSVPKMRSPARWRGCYRPWPPRVTIAGGGYAHRITFWSTANSVIAHCATLCCSHTRSIHCSATPRSTARVLEPVALELLRALASYTSTCVPLLHNELGCAYGDYELPHFARPSGRSDPSSPPFGRSQSPVRVCEELRRRLWRPFLNTLISPPSQIHPVRNSRLTGIRLTAHETGSRYHGRSVGAGARPERVRIVDQ